MRTKIFNWRTALTAHINAYRYEPYEWKEHNCCTWVASCVKIMTGEDLLKGGWEYNDEISAAMVLKNCYGVNSIQHLADKLFGERLHISSAQAGDVVLKATGKRGPFAYTVGICNGHFSFFVGEEGLEMIETLTLAGCYRV